MPNIPSYLSNQGLPSSGGIQGDVFGAPAVQQPAAQKQGPSALEQSLSAIPKGLETLGQAGVQVEELQTQQQILEAHRQKVFDVLNAKTTTQNLRLALPELDERLKREDWQKAPENLETEGRKLIDTMGKDLAPGAKALFTEQALQHLVVYKQRAVESRIHRTDQMTAFTIATEVQHAQEAMINARNPAEFEVAKGQLQTFGKQMVELGLADGVKMAGLEQQTAKAVRTGQNNAAIQMDPDAMIQQYTAQYKGEPTNPNLPTADMQELGDLLKAARATSVANMNRVEHVGRMADYAWSKKQEQSAQGLEVELSMIPIAPVSVGKYDALQQRVNQMSQGDHPLLDLAKQTALTNKIMSLKAAAVHPREVDDGPTEMRLTIAMDAAGNPTELERVRAEVYQAATLLKPETVQRFFNGLESKKDKNHYSQLNGFKEGVRILTGAALENHPVIKMLGLGGAQKDQIEADERRALDIFRGEMEQLANTSRDQANAEGRERAMLIRAQYIDGPAESRAASALARVAKPLMKPDGKPVETEEEAVAGLAKLAGTDADKQRLYQEWQDWKRLRKTVTDVLGSRPDGTPPPLASPTGRRKQ